MKKQFGRFFFTLVIVLTIIGQVPLFPSVATAQTTCGMDERGAYKVPGSTGVYFVTNNCTKRPFKNPHIFYTYFEGWHEVVTISNEQFNSVPNDELGFMPWGPKYDPKYGALVKIVTDPKVYLLLGSERYWITSEDVFNQLNYQWNWIEDIDPELLNKYSIGSEINYTDRHPNYTIVKYASSPRVYQLLPNPNNSSEQVKVHVRNESVFNSLGFRWDRIVNIPEIERYNDADEGVEPDISYTPVEVAPAPRRSTYYGGGGGSSGGSSSVNIVDTSNLNQSPASPSNLIVNAVSPDRVDLSWTDNSDNEDGFNIERSTDGNNFSQIASTLADVITYSDTDVESGTLYYYRVSSFNENGDTVSGSHSVTTPVPTSPPSAPTDLVVTVISDNRIDLTWTDNSDNESEFVIERSIDGNDFSEVGTAYPNATIYSDTGLTDGTSYHYRISARNSAGSSDSTEVDYGTTETPSVIPADPSSLSAETITESQIRLTWTDGSDNEDGFLVERSDDGVNFSEIDSIPADQTTYSDSNLSATTTYYYRVRATNTTGNSGYTNTADTTTRDVAPNTPSDLTATTQSESEISLSWTDNSDNESGFIIEWSTDGVNFDQLIIVDRDQTTFTDTDISGNTTIYYRIFAYNSKDPYLISDASSIANATTDPDPVTIPSDPTGLSLAVISSSQINLGWTDNSNNEEGFIVQRSTDGTNFTTINTTPVNATVFSNTGLNSETTYYYRVAATNEAGNSGFTNTENETTPVEQTTPTAPSGAVATSFSSSIIDLIWEDNSNNESGFFIERSTDGTNFLQTDITGPGESSIRDEGLGSNTTYYYRVTAYNDGGNSAYSNITNATTDEIAPEIPNNLQATAVSASSIDLTWTDNSDNEDEFIIRRSLDDVNYTDIATVGANITSYTDTGLSAQTTYYYRIAANNSAGNSGYANHAYATTETGSGGGTITDGLVARWRLDETSGTVADESIGNFDGALANGPTWTTGHVNGALSFDGVDDYVDIGDETFGLSDAMSISLWAYIDAETGTYQNFVQRGRYVYPFLLQVTGARILRTCLRTSDGAHCNTGTNVQLNTGEWHHVVLTYDGSTRIAYLNSEVSRSDSFGGTLDLRSGQPVNFGRNPNNEYYLDGRLDDIRIYNRALTPDEVNSIFNGNESSEPVAPSAPSSMNATAVSSQIINLTWNDNAYNETGIRIERSTDGSNFSQIASLSANTESYSDTGLNPSTQYYYRAYAFNAVGNSGHSNINSATTEALPTIPSAPSGLSATAQSSSRISISWADNSDNEDNFLLERSSNGVNYTQIAELDENTTSYSNSGLSASTLYYYRVRSSNEAGNSGYSNVANATTLDQGSSGSIVADHTHMNIYDIPISAINDAKNTLHIAYAHTSHGSHITAGMSELDEFMSGKSSNPTPAGTYAVSLTVGQPGAGVLDVDDYYANFPGSRDLGEATEIANFAWDQATRDFLDDPANSHINVMMWSWCGGASRATQAGMAEYLSRMNQLEQDYPNVRFVYMTGHTDGSGLGGNLHQRNEQIRDYVVNNDKALFDFADIESYNLYLEYFGDRNVDERCNYTGGNWCLEYQNSHTQDEDWYQASAAHSNWVTSNQKAYAAWWLWARLAGWDGN